MSHPLRVPELPAAKRLQILAGARQVFSDVGFERASVDLIAARSGVSKATVYNHFDDKKALFVACFSEGVDEMRAGLRACLGEPEGDFEQALQAIGEKMLTFTLSPAVGCLYRHTIAEAGRFPEVGQMLFERGPKVFQDALAAWLERWRGKAALRIDDPRSAAVQFAALCQGDLLLRAQLGILPHPAPEQVRDNVARAVRTFLRAYRT